MRIANHRQAALALVQCTMIKPFAMKGAPYFMKQLRELLKENEWCPSKRLAN